MSVRSVLVVGGGFTGLTAAIALAQRGVERVTLVDRAPGWARVGHGLMLQGNALQVFRQIGVLDELLAKGCAENSLTLSFADGRVMAQFPTPRTGGPDFPATFGVLRSDLHEILVHKAESLGVEIRLGRELISFENHGAEASTLLSDGATEFWELVIVADGIRSQTRPMLGIAEDRASSGLGVWRAVTDRTPRMTGGIAFALEDFGGAYQVGYIPVSATQCYIFVLCRPERPQNGLPDWQEVKRLMADFHGDVDVLRDSIDASTVLDFQEIEWIFVDAPWHKGRVIALGEAVHAMPPLLAQGAAQCVEDSLVLTGLVTREGDLERQFAEFYARRIPRIKSVAEASLQLVASQQHPGTPGADAPRVMFESLQALVTPA